MNKNHYVLIGKLHLVLGNLGCNYVCRQSLNSYTRQNVMIQHKQQCVEHDIASIRLCNESRLLERNWKNWKKVFHKNPLSFRIYAAFEADNEFDNTYICNKTTNNYKQSPVLNGYYIKSELDDVLKSGYYESPIGYNNLYWFVNEVIKVKNQMAVYSKILTNIL